MSEIQRSTHINATTSVSRPKVRRFPPTRVTLPDRSYEAEPSSDTGGTEGVELNQAIDVEAAPLSAPALTQANALLDALAECHGYPGQRFFRSRTEHRLAVLTPAYRLALEIVRGGEPAYDVAVRRMPVGLRQRSPSREKPELLAVQITAKPETSSQRKQCSALASLLMVARTTGLSVEEFPVWATEADLEDCRLKAKRIRMALRAGIAPDLDEESDSAITDEETPWVQVSYGHGTKTIETYSTPLSAGSNIKIAAFVKAGIAGIPLPDVLRQVADLLDSDRSTELPSFDQVNYRKISTPTPPNTPTTRVERAPLPRDILRDLDESIRL